MDKSLIFEAMDVVLPQMKTDLYVNDWDIEIQVESIGGGTPAICRVHPYYRSARITIDPCETPDIDSLVRNLRHELLHVVIAPVDEYRRLIMKGIKRGARRIAREAYHQAQERCVTQIESILDISLQIGMDKYVRMLEDHLAKRKEN